MTRTTSTISGGLIILMIFSSVLSMAAGLDQRFLRARQDNATPLKRYEWKSRTEIQTDGETRSVTVNSSSTAIVLIPENYDFTVVHRRAGESVSLRTSAPGWKDWIVNVLRFGGALLYVQAAPAAPSIICASQQV